MIQALGQRVVDICIMVLLRLFNSLAVFVVLLFRCAYYLFVFMFFSYCACDDFVANVSHYCVIFI